MCEQRALSTDEHKSLQIKMIYNTQFKTQGVFQSYLVEHIKFILTYMMLIYIQVSHGVLLRSNGPYISALVLLGKALSQNTSYMTPETASFHPTAFVSAAVVHFLWR